jgi:hypothetical protein
MKFTNKHETKNSWYKWEIKSNTGKKCKTGKSLTPSASLVSERFQSYPRVSEISLSCTFAGVRFCMSQPVGEIRISRYFSRKNFTFRKIALHHGSIFIYRCCSSIYIYARRNNFHQHQSSNVTTGSYNRPLSAPPQQTVQESVNNLDMTRPLSNPSISDNFQVQPQNTNNLQHYNMMPPPFVPWHPSQMNMYILYMPMHGTWNLPPFPTWRPNTGPTQYGPNTAM